MQEIVVVSEEQKKLIDDIDRAMDLLWATEHVLWSDDLAPNGVDKMRKGQRTYRRSASGHDRIIFKCYNCLYDVRNARSFVSRVLDGEDVTEELSKMLFATFDDQTQLLKIIAPHRITL